MNLTKLIATKEDENRKINKFISSYFKDLPQSKIYKIFRNKDIKVNGKRTNDTNLVLHENDVVEIYGLKEEKPELFSYDNKLKLSSKIIYEDDNILIVDKRANVAVHGDSKSLDNQVLAYLKYNQNSSFKPSHVGRLDKATSGLMIYAKNYASLVELNYKTGDFDKIYQFESEYNGTEKTISLKIRHDEKLQKMIVDENHPKSTEAITRIFKDGKQWYAQIYTGKKHQIRITMEYLKCPIYGDIKYGGRSRQRLHLHCCSITFKNLANNLEYLNNKTFSSNITWEE